MPGLQPIRGGLRDALAPWTRLTVVWTTRAGKSALPRRGRHLPYWGLTRTASSLDERFHARLAWPRANQACGTSIRIARITDDPGHYLLLTTTSSAFGASLLHRGLNFLRTIFNIGLVWMSQKIPLERRVGGLERRCREGVETTIDPAEAVIWPHSSTKPLLEV